MRYSKWSSWRSVLLSECLLSTACCAVVYFQIPCEAFWRAVPLFAPRQVCLSVLTLISLLYMLRSEVELELDVAMVVFQLKL